MESADEYAQQRRIEFGNRLRAARVDRQWSQEALAEHAGVERKLIYRTELGTHSPKLDTAFKLAAALRVSLSELVQGID